MSSLPRLFAVLGLASANALIPDAAARAQLYGVRSGAAHLTTVDAAAIGDTVRSSVGLFVGGPIAVAAGIGAFGGALRVSIGSEVNLPANSLGVGYARTFAWRDLSGPVHVAIGTELVGGFRHEPSAVGNAGALNLAAPLGVSLGDPSGTSLGVYAAPYVEAGLMRVVERVGACTPFCNYRWSDVGLHSAAGIGLGARVALGRLSLELFLRDARWNRQQVYGLADGTLGVTYRLGR